MEINITKFFTEATARDYSASVAEIGNNAGADTWRAACDDSADYLILDTEDKREAFRHHIKGCGAWDDTEIAAMSDTALNALCIQFIAGDMRENGLDVNPVDWQAYEADDSLNHTIFKGIDNEIYYTLD